MVLAHILDSWTRDGDRQSAPYYTLSFIAGIASPLFLFLAGVTAAISATAKAARDGSHRAGAIAVRRRGWEIFGLGLLFRVQAQVLGFGPLTNLFKVDMLNMMGLSMVIASALWQTASRRSVRLLLFAAAVTAIAMTAPLVRAAPGLAGLPDPLEAYLRPAGVYAGFPFFPWGGFLFAGVILGDALNVLREDRRRTLVLQIGLAVLATFGAWLAWRASFEPPLFPTARFWHDSPTFFFIRLGLVAVTIPVAFAVSDRLPNVAAQPLAALGRASLFAYWVHIELVYGLVAEPLKRTLPLWGSLLATVAMIAFLYWLARFKNRMLERYTLRGPARMFNAVLR
jgi:acyltransferase